MSFALRFNRANAGDPEGLAALCLEAVEFRDVPEIPGSGIYRGREGIRDWLQSVREISDDLQLQIWLQPARGGGR